MSAPSEMDEGTPEVGESSTSSEAPIPVPLPQPSSTPSPPYKVGVMRQSSGHQGVHPYHDEWLANLFSSGLPSPELPTNFPLAIRWVLMSPFLTLLSLMLELLGWSIDLGQALLELMFLLSLCRVRHLRLIHECANQVVVQMANPGLDPVNAAEFHVADMLQQSHLLTGTETPPHIPHLASCPIDFHVGAVRSQIATDTSFDPTNPDHINNAVDQLRRLVDH